MRKEDGVVDPTLVTLASSLIGTPPRLTSMRRAGTAMPALE